MEKILMLMNKKNVFYILLFLFVIGVVPILVLAGYSFPCADDFSASDTVCHAWQQTGSIFQVIKAAIENVIYNYKEWSGVFASVFWTSLQFGIFGEQYYGLTTWITVVLLSVSSSYFFYVSLHKYLAADVYETGIVTLLYLFSLIQCMPSGVEGLYWHAGVVNYTWAYSFLLLLAALQLSLLKETDRRKKLLKYFLACFLAILVGGGNFITALQGVLWLGLILSSYFLFLFTEKGEKILLIIKKLVKEILPFLTLLFSFGISVTAPGNKVRMESSSGLHPVRAILLSFSHALEEPLETWLSWPVVVLWLLSIPFLAGILVRKKFLYRYPILVAVLGFCFVAAGFTPSLYAQGAMEAGRLHNTVFFLWLLILYLETIYFTGWFLSRNTKKKGKRNERQRIGTLCLLIFFVMFSTGTILWEEETYIGVKAARTFVSGEAQQYKAENEIRIGLLTQSKEDEVVVPRLTVYPQLLLFQEISHDPGEWINTAVAKYYGKKSVRTE